ncbi:apolipoprotein C-I-like [Pagrus major]|uniref:apolipoprotein C-I-like n=1 Tax=Pagrus major TaxID=143350 RepID=UPI003CC88E32
MRLFLAVAVLMLAFVAYTEAQEETIEQKFTEFGERVTQVGQDLAEKAKTAFENINNSEFAVTSRNWFSEQIEKLKTMFQDNSQ